MINAEKLTSLKQILQYIRRGLCDYEIMSGFLSQYVFYFKHKTYITKNVSGMGTFKSPELKHFPDNLIIPEGVNAVYFYSLTSAKGLKLPKGVRYVSLSSLTSAKGLNLPEGVETVCLRSLTSAEGLKIPEGCYIYAPDCPEIHGKH